MSYTELEHGYQGLRKARPAFYVGDESGNVRLVKNRWIDDMSMGFGFPLGLAQSNLLSKEKSVFVAKKSALHLTPVGGDLSELNDDELCGEEGKQVVVGVCAMAKKSQSKPMKEILTRLAEFEYIKMIVFAEEVILQKPVHEWPTVDCLISFHSKGFPLDKAIQYAALRNPFVINNLHMQYDIQDRRKVYSILESEGIEIPRYAVLDRDSTDPTHHELVESEDHVEVNGVTFNKPFVEKPVSAEDHNIYIYYPTSAGGGSQRLFRKIGSRSSVYSPESRVRKTGSFIYEDFMPTDGTDVKVYTVGPDYAHAEARKSPALDGKVERDSEGKEIRYPVILSNAEKLISRKVCLAFKQTVCGFDLLRANGKSFVCDVNGFSFVKNSNKYYDDCAKILGNMILRELAPTLHIPWSVPFQLDDPPIVPTTFGKMMELRCVVAVIRHGDRTPKQKMKVEVRHPKFFEIFEKYGGRADGHVKLKRPKQLQEILDIARSLLSEIEHRAADPEIEEKQGKLEQLKSVLEMYGHFSGINRKVQMKYQPKGRPRGSSSDDGKGNNAPKEPSLVLILKWGGELTPAGRVQAEELGRIFRCMYPGGQGRHAGGHAYSSDAMGDDESEEDFEGEYAGTQGLGLLRLHSTFRHDLKIYASDEGRVQMTAAAFAKGLLALEGELTPILVQMVKSANTNGLLDNDCDASKHQNMAKARLHELMQQDRLFTLEDREIINPCNSISITMALDFVKNPVKCCERVQDLIQRLMNIVRAKKDDPKTKDAILYHGETWELMMRRWGKIEKDFCTKNKTFDISKIPDIYDCIKYDLQHNQHTLQFEQAEELYINAKYLADIVIPQEYGLTKNEKLTISQGICTPLLKKIRADLQRNIEESGDESVNRLNPRYSHGVSSPGRHVRTRLYFTSESHIHSLLTVLRHGDLLDCVNDEQWRRAMEYVSMVSELNYMSQVVVMLYEDPTKDPCSEERFHVELHFSPGVNCCVQKNLPPGPGFRPHSRNDQSKHLSSIDQEDTHTDDNSSSIRSNSPGALDSSFLSKKKNQQDISSEFKLKMVSSEPIPIRSVAKLPNEADLTVRLIDEENQSLSVSAQDPRPPSQPEPRSRSYDQNRGNEKTDSTDNSNTISIISSASKCFDTSGVLNELPNSVSNQNKMFEKTSFSHDNSYAEKLKLFNNSNLKKGDILETISSKNLIKFNRSLSSGDGLREEDISNGYSLFQSNCKQGIKSIKKHTSLGKTLSEMYSSGSDSKLDIQSLDLAHVEIYSSRNKKMERHFNKNIPYNINFRKKFKHEAINSTKFNILKTNPPHSQKTLTVESKTSTVHNENKKQSVKCPFIVTTLNETSNINQPNSDCNVNIKQTDDVKILPENPLLTVDEGDKDCTALNPVADKKEEDRNKASYNAPCCFSLAEQKEGNCGTLNVKIEQKLPDHDKRICTKPLFSSAKQKQDNYDNTNCDISLMVKVLQKEDNINEICNIPQSDIAEQKGRYYDSKNCDTYLMARVKQNEPDHDKENSNKPPFALIEQKEEYSAKQNIETFLTGFDEQNEAKKRIKSIDNLKQVNTSITDLVEKSSSDSSEQKGNYDSDNCDMTLVELKKEDHEIFSSETPLFTLTEHKENKCPNLKELENPTKLKGCMLSYNLNQSHTTADINHLEIQSDIDQSVVNNSENSQSNVNSCNFKTLESSPCSDDKSEHKETVPLKSPKFIFVKNKLSSQRSTPEFYSDAFIKSHNIPSDLVNCYFQIVDDPDILDFPMSSISETRVKYPLKNTIDETEISPPPLEPYPVHRKYISYPSAARRTHSISHCLEMNRLSPPSIDPGPSRRHRHSISGQMSYFRMSGYGLIIQHQKRGGSTSSLFSTAVISGSSSAPNLRDMIPNSGSVTAAIDGCGGVPSIRPLETLHNALSLRQLDGFLDTMTHSNIGRTPASSPPIIHSTTLGKTVQSPNNSMVWSGSSSFVSSSGPSSPNGLSDFFRELSGTSDSSDMSASIISNDGLGSLGPGFVLDDENSYYSHRDNMEIAELCTPRLNSSMLFSPHHGGDSGELTPVSIVSEAEQVYRPCVEELVTHGIDGCGDNTTVEDLEQETMICEDEEEEKTLTAFTRDECARPRLAEIKWHRDDEELKVKKFAYGRFECSEAILEKPSPMESQSMSSVSNITQETAIFGNEFNMDVCESVEGISKEKYTQEDDTTIESSTLYISDPSKIFQIQKTKLPILPLNKQIIENETLLNEEMFEMDSELAETKSKLKDTHTDSQQVEGNCSSCREERTLSEISNQTIMSRSPSPILTVASSLKDSKCISRGFIIPKIEPEL